MLTAGLLLPWLPVLVVLVLAIVLVLRSRPFPWVPSAPSGQTTNS